MIRTFLVAVFLLFFFIISLILWPIELLIGKFNRHARDIGCLRLVQWALRGVLFLSGVKTTIIGLENIPKDEPVLFIGNHHGFYDIIITYPLMQRPTGFVAKKSMNNVPFIRIWMKLLYCLFLDRDNMKEGLKTILTGIEYIKQGISIVIFPEGTRNQNDGVGPFHAGSFKFAEKTGCKIIPMVQNNTEAIFENQIPRIKSRHTVLEFGEPIDISSFPKEERKNISNYTWQVISRIYEKNKSLV